MSPSKREADLSYARASESTRRKADHIHVCLERDVEFQTLTTGFERIAFTYEALPEIDLCDVDTSTRLFGKRLSMPLMISPITGGTEEGREINRRLASAAQKLGIAMGVGSQRVALEDPSLRDTFRVRDVAPDILLFANLGAVQLNNGHGVESCVRAVEMIDADAMMLHINPLQECVQHHGNTNFRDLAARIKAACQAVEVPVVVKEVGHGISARTAELLVDAGVSGVDVAGAGGTSWAKVESLRDTDPRLTELGRSLGEWGIPTVDSLVAVRGVAPNIAVIASGGIRTGEDIAKSIALGADAAGIALPLLRCAAESEEALHEKLIQLRRELSAVMFCTGSRNIPMLRDVGLRGV
jgi:isopentenyl-diphosphate delta-isomerase